MPSEAAQLAAIEQAVWLMRDVVRRPIPGGLSGASARRYVTVFSEAERVAGSGVALFSPKVVESGEHTKDGHGSAAEWLGKLSGSSSGVAKGRLAAASRAAKDPLLTKALHEGELSSDQLKVVTTTLGEVPGATGELLKLLDEGASHKELSDQATRMRAAARSREDERLRRARVHTNRHFRWGQDDNGGVKGSFSCDETEFARIAPRLEAEARRRWKAAGNGNDTGDSLEAHRLDAFIDLMGGGLRGAVGGRGVRTVLGEGEGGGEGGRGSADGEDEDDYPDGDDDEGGSGGGPGRAAARAPAAGRVVRAGRATPRRAP